MIVPEKPKAKREARVTRSRSQMQIPEALFIALDEGRRVELVTQIAVAMVKNDADFSVIPGLAVNLADRIFEQLKKTKVDAGVSRAAKDSDL